MSNISLAVGTVGMSFHESCIVDGVLEFFFDAHRKIEEKKMNRAAPEDFPDWDVDLKKNFTRQYTTHQLYTTDLHIRCTH